MNPCRAKPTWANPKQSIFFLSGNYVCLLWCLTCTEHPMLGTSQVRLCLHPALFPEPVGCTEKGQGLHLEHPKIPCPSGSLAEDHHKEAWFCHAPSLLAASSAGAEQRQNKSRHQISCNPVMNTMLAAVLICSLCIEENCSLSLLLPRQVLNGGLIPLLSW